MTRPRDNKGRLVPKFGVAKWGNDYWGYGVSYQDWKYRHPASVRVFAEGYGVDLKGLTSAQKDWLKMRYEEDVDSKTALFALIDEFNLRSRRVESFSGEWIGDEPFQEYLPDKEDVKVTGVVALTGLILGWFINNQLLRKK